jgi:hypothetical protein
MRYKRISSGCEVRKVKVIGLARSHQEETLPPCVPGVRRAFYDDRQTEEVSCSKLHIGSGRSALAGESKAGATSSGIKSSRIVCCVDKTCTANPRNVCIICEANVCDYHSDGRLWARRDALGELTTGHSCANCIFEAERQADRGYIKLIAGQSRDPISLEDAIRIQKIMERLHES